MLINTNRCLVDKRLNNHFVETEMDYTNLKSKFDCLLKYAWRPTLWGCVVVKVQGVSYSLWVVLFGQLL